MNTAFIIYRERERASAAAMAQLANQLRTMGVHCELASFHVHNPPSEGWPEWCERKVETSRFVLVLCDEASYNGFKGLDGESRGASHEGTVLRSIVYRRSGPKPTFICIGFGTRNQVEQWILPELFGFSYHDLNTEQGFRNLYGQLTDQPVTPMSPVGSIQDLSSSTFQPLAPLYHSVSASLLQALAQFKSLPTPFPIEAFQNSLALSDQEISTLIGEGLLLATEKHGASLIAVAETVKPSVFDPHIAATALELLYRMIETACFEAVMDQIKNAMELARRCPAERFYTVSKLFYWLNPEIKNIGDKQLVKACAEISIRAAQQKGRGDEEVKSEALATICGLSWYYQRTNDLDRALSLARLSRDLGESVGWTRNTAFVDKCVGRIWRLKAEASENEQQRAAYIASSIRSIESAIELFPKASPDLKQHQITAELGDCYSLLSRTHFVDGDFESALEWAGRAEKALKSDASSKDALDLRILQAELAMQQGLVDQACAKLDSVVEVTTRTYGELNEIRARALVRRGRIYAAGNHFEKSKEDFGNAAQIWRRLNEPDLADEADWECISLTESLPTALRARLISGYEAAGVKVAAVQIYGQRTNRLFDVVEVIGNRGSDLDFESLIAEANRKFWRRPGPRGNTPE